MGRSAFDAIPALLADLAGGQHDPWLGRVLGEFALRTGARSVLELGTGRGGSTCWLAAGVMAAGGVVTTIDRRTGPDVEPLLARAGLDRFVRVVRAEHSYTWELLRLIEAHTAGGRCVPPFDLCFLDGAHSWDADGFAFFLVEKLLRPGGWIVFDDLDWTYADATDLAPADAELAALMPDDARGAAQVGLVFELLVRQHPAMDVARVHGRRGWARKAGAGDPEAERRLVERLLAWIPPGVTSAPGESSAGA